MRGNERERWLGSRLSGRLAGIPRGTKMDKEPNAFASLYVVFVWPVLLAWPVVWALVRWPIWEGVVWAIGAGAGAYLWVRERDRERAAAKRGTEAGD
jgi:hypothetical protein